MLDIAKYNVDNQLHFGGDCPGCVLVKELDWLKPIKGLLCFPLLFLKNNIKNTLKYYRIYPAIRRGFCPSRMTSNN